MNRRAATIYRWDELPQDSPLTLLKRRRIIGEQVMLSEVLLEKGCEVAEHSHENEQFACIVRGRARFTVVDPDGSRRDELLERGQVLYLPAFVPHGVEALEETLVLDIFSPVSQTTGVDEAAAADQHAS
ncbi:MAG: cupin domain-containing protein [Planctomycetota bacterium]|jgi:quercetin dioxygenase-like cupin family protein